MGIKNLLIFLSEFSDVVKEIDKTNYYGKKIAIDISILLYQVVIAIRNTGGDLLNSNGEIISHILGLFNKTLYFLEIGIIPIYVFDGKPPKIKEKVLQLRKNNRHKALYKLNDDINTKDKIKYLKRSVWVSQTQMNQCRELLKLMGIPYINAPEEADSQLSYLCKSNMVYAVLTEDMDILTFGSPIIIRNLISNKKQPIEIELQTILNKLNLAYTEFIDLCILFGCDYCHHISNIKPKDIYKIYIKTKSLEKTLYELKQMGYYISDHYNYQLAKQYFINPEYNLINKKEIILHKPKINELFSLLVNKYELNKKIIYNKLNKLDNYYNKLKDLL
jgi:flap endonuclease-1